MLPESRNLPLSLLLLSLVRASRSCQPLSTTPDQNAAANFAGQKFDYVIVGAGPAGLAVATSLSEDPTVTVGVIEAGYLHINDSYIDVPGDSGEVGGNPNYDWAYSTIPQVNADGRVIAAPLGKMIGGSSGINLMGWDRGAKGEYDAWGQFVSRGGWNWTNFLPYLRKVENFNLKAFDPFPNSNGSYFDPRYNGIGGPIQATLHEIYMGDVNPYVSAWNALNVTTVKNPYSGSKSGIYNVRMAIDPVTETRSYGAPAYYCPASTRPNLHFITNAVATKILFKPSAVPGAIQTATGVTFEVAGTQYTANAGSEVIVSTGTMKTPQLLELSGIGNKNILSSLGIETLIDLPGVGENLQDHIFTPSQFEVASGVQTFDQLRNDPTFAAEQQTLYDTNRTGWLTATDSAIAFLPLQSIMDTPTVMSWVQTQGKAINNDTTLTPLQQAQYKIQLDWLASGSVPQTEFILFSKGFVPQPGQSYFSLLSGIQHPFSRGSVHINSTDPHDAPIVDPNYLSNAFDVKVLGRVTQVSTTLSQTSPISDIVVGKQLPPPSIASGDDFEGYAQGSFGSGSHLIGTSAMADQALGGVVDATLKVYGTSNLRVADISIIPLHISAHMQATAFAIGEKAADLIKADNL